MKGAPNNLKLTGKVLADIFLGNIKQWNDPAIAALNPGVSLPSTHITPIYRSDGSGTSFVFTDYLSSVDPDWASKVGTSTQPTFPVGTGRRAQLRRDRCDAGHGRRHHLRRDVVRRS